MDDDAREEVQEAAREDDNGELRRLSPRFTQRQIVAVAVAACAVVLICTALVVFSISTSGSDGVSRGVFLDDDELAEDGSYPQRLPAHTTPLLYRMHYRPDIAHRSFAGVVDIDIRVTEQTDTVTLHAAQELRIDAADIALNVDSTTPDPEHSLAYSRLHRDALSEFLIIDFGTPIPPGDHVLSLAYHGALNNDLRGCYYSTYSVDGVEHSLTTTHFESTDARRCFPCFDEPALKASFLVSIDVPSGMIALSNMPERDGARSVELPETRVALPRVSTAVTTVRFQRSPPMSTYLLCFVVGRFESVGGVIPLSERASDADSDLPVRVWAVEGRGNSTALALDTALRSVPWFEQYFDVAFRLPKLDLVAIPDFASGATEHWGVITFRETSLLLDPKSASATNRQRVVTVITHEEAHQWTGNLVTMEWWDDLWLNEGFASFLETECAAALYPEWKMQDQAYVLDAVRALDKDALPSSHPMKQPARDGSEIRELFDTISYSKGASILYMFEQALGEEVFRHRLAEYLRKYQYSTATTDQLLDALAANDDELKGKLESWVLQRGFPLITLERRDDALVIRQQPYDTDGQGDVQENRCWWVPLRVLSAEGISHEELTCGEPEQVLGGVFNAGVRWAKDNAMQASFTRAKYDEGLFSALMEEVGKPHTSSDAISTVDRAAVMNDAFALATDSKQSVVAALQVAEALEYERDYVVWRSSFTGLGHLGMLLSGEPCYGSFKHLMRLAVAPVLNEIGWKEADSLAPQAHLNSLLRSLISSAAVQYGVEEAVEMANELFWQLVRGESSPSGDVRGAVFLGAVMYGGEREFNALVDYLATPEVQSNSAEQARVLAVLGRTPLHYLQKRTLEMCMDESKVRKQDRVTCVASVARNPTGRDMAWDHVREYWAEFNQRGFALTNLITAVTGSFSDELHADDIESFFSANPPDGGARTAWEAVIKIRSNAKWLMQNAADACAYLQHWQAVH